MRADRVVFVLDASLTVINVYCISGRRKKERAGMFCCTCEVSVVVTRGSGSDGSYQNLLRRKAELISLKGPSYFLRAQSEFFSGAFIPFTYREGEIIDFQ